MEISDLIKSARIEKGLTQQQLADSIFVTRQTISKWELGKSVPDQASLVLLYQCLDIKDNEKKQLSRLIFNKQNIILVLMVFLFSPMVIGIRFICYKMDKIDNRKIKAIIKTIGFSVFSLYLISLKENVAYLLISIFSIMYLLYRKRLNLG
ncbi:helix-turn-helix domain-containing protein [[Ruminococcus] torques]|uniref:helix-turn-helix domain-containing protein n=1 Tax=[Ruminococcus] torques TaxID=33039 RepID=UPI003AB7C443